MYSSYTGVAIIAILAAFVASSYAVDLESIKRLDAELVNRSDSTDVKDILKVAKSVLRIEKLRMMFSGFKQRKKHQGLVRFLEKFTKLEAYDPANVTCSAEEYDMMNSNNKVIEEFDKIGWNRTSPDVSRVRSVIKLFRRVGAEHADTCRDIYPVVFKAKYEKLNKDALLLITFFTSFMIEDRVFPLGRTPEYERGLPIFALYREVMDDHYFEHWNDRARDAVIAYAEVENTARVFPDIVLAEKNLEITTEAERVEDLLNRYVILPCEYLIDELGRSVFWPAKLENTEPYSEVSKLTERDPEGQEMHKFYQTWLQFRICELFARDGAQSLAKIVVEQMDASKKGSSLESDANNYDYLRVESGSEFDSDDEDTVLIFNSKDQ